MRDIQNYAEKYDMPGFEEYKVYYRRRKILEFIEKYQPRNILEIGCGKEPLFEYVNDVAFTIVEPSETFYYNALELAGKRGNVICYNGFFEDVAEKLTDKYDAVICAGLLHEVEEPERLVKAIYEICTPNTIIHINVPNANSLHRILGKEMGILKNVHDMTKGNIEFQQHTNFDRNSLNKIVENNGFKIIEQGALFVKPFSHEQMYTMLKNRIIDITTLEGLYKLGEYMPEFASEIYVNCKLK